MRRVDELYDRGHCVCCVLECAALSVCCSLSLSLSAQGTYGHFEWGREDKITYARA